MKNFQPEEPGLRRRAQPEAVTHWHAVHVTVVRVTDFDAGTGVHWPSHFGTITCSSNLIQKRIEQLLSAFRRYIVQENLLEEIEASVSFSSTDVLRSFVCFMLMVFR